MKITKYKAHFAPEQSVAIFFFLAAYQKQVKCTASQLAKKKEQFSPRSASAVKWVLDNIRTFILQSKKSREERDHVFSVRPFRHHLFSCRTFSAQIISAPIQCSLTVRLFRVRVTVSQKTPNIGAEKVRTKIVARKSRGPNRETFLAAKTAVLFCYITQSL